MVFDVIAYESLGCEKEFPPPAVLPTSTMRPSTSREPLSSFRILMSSTHRCPKKSYVTIPTEFVRSVGLGDKSKMILRTAGKEWQVGLGTWHGSARDRPDLLPTAIRTKGWREFYKDDGAEGRTCLHI